MRALANLTIPANSHLSAYPRLMPAPAGLRARTELRMQGRFTEASVLKAINHTFMPSASRAGAAGAIDEAVFNTYRDDQAREAYLGPTLNGLYRAMRDRWRDWTRQTPVPPRPQADAHASEPHRSKPHDTGTHDDSPVRAHRTERAAYAEAGERRRVVEKDVRQGIGFDNLRGTPRDTHVFDVDFPLDRRFLSVTTACGVGRNHLWISDLDDRVMSICMPVGRHPHASKACLIDRQQPMYRDLARVLVKMQGIDPSYNHTRLDLVAIRKFPTPTFEPPVQEAHESGAATDGIVKRSSASAPAVDPRTWAAYITVDVYPPWMTPEEIDVLQTVSENGTESLPLPKEPEPYPPESSAGIEAVRPNPPPWWNSDALPVADDVLPIAYGDGARSQPLPNEPEPYLWESPVKIEPKTPVIVPRSLVNAGVRIANLKGRLGDEYLFRLELPRAVSRLHVFTSCDRMDALSVTLATQDMHLTEIAGPIHSRRVEEDWHRSEDRWAYGNWQWTHGNTSTSYVSVIDVPRPEQPNSTHISANVTGIDDWFRGVVFNAKAIYDEPRAYGHG